MLLMREGRIADAVDLRAAAPDPGERAWLAGRLAQVGPEELAAEFVLSGASPTIARLAVQALKNGDSEGE
jgi:hypothetical protein